MDRYDENLLENPFYQELASHFKNLNEKAAAQKWIICVPRIGSFLCCEFTPEDFEHHILIANPEEHNSFKTLNGKNVTIENNVITTGNDFPELHTVHILFEELFYTKSSGSFRILCIEHLLEGKRGDGGDGLSVAVQLHSLKECIDLLWREVGDQRIMHQVDEIIENWNAVYQSLEFETVQYIRDLVSALYTKVLQAVLKDPALKKKSWADKQLLESVKLAVETYTMHGVYKRVMKGVTAYLAREDAHLNKTVRNLSDLQLRDLHIKPEFTMSVPRARQELSRIDWFTTPLEKLACIRRSVFAISQSKSSNSSPSQSGDSIAMRSDDLLPILVFLVLKIGMPNWLAHLVFMKNFQLSQNPDDAEKDEHGFYLASLEAAIEHVRSGALLGSSSPECLLEYSDTVDGVSQMFPKMDLSKDDNSPSIRAFFDFVKQGKVDEVVSMLEDVQPTIEAEQPKLCHPLCSCDQCEQQQRQFRCNTAPTISSRDDRGCTALHIAALYGQDLVVDELIKCSADVNATDYRGSTPLHLACQRGHQNATLLLLYHGAVINIVDNDGNTPLHMCSSNGHEDCVKALIYYDEHTNGLLQMNCANGKSIQLNATNDNGDTPLHYAARWGYDGIVKLLLDYGACPESKNKRKQTPLDSAHSANVLRLLERALDDTAAGHNGGFVPIEYSRSPPTVATVTVSQSATYKRQATSSSPASANLMKKINKLMKAITKGDVNLACFYLGIDNDFDVLDNDSTAVSSTTPVKLCHPLCQCGKCKLQQNSSLTGLSPTDDPQHVAVNSTNAEGQTPLHVACLHGQRDLVRILLKNGAQMNCQTRKERYTPLHLACQQNQLTIVDILLSHHALVDIVDIAGNTALYHCCVHGRNALTKKLLEHGATVNEANLKGNTPLHEAVWRQHQSLVEVLMQYGADANIANKQNLTPKDLSKDAIILRLLGEASVLYQKRTTTVLDMPPLQ